MSTEVELFKDLFDLMELCAQLEAEQGRIYEALPKLKESIEAGAKQEYETLTKRAETIEGHLAKIAEHYIRQDSATKAEFARLEKAINARGKELADYSKKLEMEVPKPIEEKIRSIFATMPKPKDGEPGAPGPKGKDASLLTGFRGNWKDDAQYLAGEWFTFRGSSYLVLRDCKGKVPTKITQTGTSAFYAVFAMSGAPGLPSVGVGPGTGDVVGPASSTNNAFALYDGLTGKLLKNSDVTYSTPTLSVPDGFVVSSAGSIGLRSAGSSAVTIANATVLPPAYSGFGWQLGSYGLIDNVGDVALIRMRRTNGSAASPTATVSGNAILSMEARGYKDTAYSASAGGWSVYAAATWTDASTPTYIDFFTTATGSIANSGRLRIGEYGRITSTPVNGSLAAWGVSGALFTRGSATITDSSSSGTVATAVANSFAVPTFAASSATTFTNAANLYIAGDVANGTNVTLTNSYGLWNVGKTRLDGRTGIGLGATATSILSLAASTTGVSSLNIPHGVAPSSPVNGDMWTTTAGLFIRINGVTVGPLS